MPQPIRTKCHLEITGLSQRPQHAMVLGQIVGISGRLESALGWLLALFSRGSASITVAMFHAVVSTDAQRAMLLAAAEKSLGATELDAFKELMEDFRPRYGERSKLVHNIWAHSNDHPDKAIWVRSSDVAFSWAQIAASTNVLQIAEAEDLSLKCMAYTVQDLTDVAARLDEYLRRVNAFLYELMKIHPLIVAVTKAATSAPPTSAEPQLDLPQPDQTDPQLDRQE
jgi:hypothetical protein